MEMPDLMRKNKTKNKLQAGKNVYGAVVGFDSPDTVELLGSLGFDYVILDLEHEVFDELSVQHSIRAAESFDITPIVRVSNNPDLILRLLDAGAQGVHIPRINTRWEAEAVVEACRFHPYGKRSFFAVGRNANYGINLTEEEYAKRSNSEIMVVLQIEEEEGIRNIKEILTVPGLDVIQFGPKDLWQSMGMPDRELVWKIIDESIVQSINAGLWVSMYAWMNEQSEQQLRHYHELGIRMVTVQARELLIYGARQFHRYTSGLQGN